mmetsp:Transcript_31436/g.71437  ORF Transcript_31436/g.71437 Transcript_31436/m.71437 type:complete len:156 (-) Transcript_31436:304-771(-)
MSRAVRLKEDADSSKEEADGAGMSDREVSRRLRPKEDAADGTFRGIDADTGTVAPALLTSYYDITPNTGSTRASQASQSAFGFVDQYFPPSDLSQFQSTYGLPQQTAEEVGGHVSDAKCVEDADNCGEANLDMQYLMAVSQAPTSYGTCLTQTGS